MPVPTPINLNDNVPAPPSGRLNVKWQADGGNPKNVSAHIPNLGDVEDRTGTSETVGPSSQGKLVSFANASPVSVTLDSAALAEGFFCAVQNLGAGTVTLTPSSGTINGQASVDVESGTGGWLFFDGTNWKFMAGGGGSGVTFTGDLDGSASTQEVIGIGSIPVDLSSSPEDGQAIRYDAGSGKWVFVSERPVQLPSAIAGKPSAGQLVFAFTVGEPMEFPANFASPDSRCSQEQDPTATATYSFYKNGVLFGTLQINTDGSHVFATVGGTAVSVSANDRLTGFAPNPQDATLSGVSINLFAVRTPSAGASCGKQIFTFRCAYDNATTYNANDVVSYQGALYVATQPTTGHAPSDPTYWDKMLGDLWNFRGAYDGGTAYVPNDVVTHLDSTWLCIAASTGNAPPNATCWSAIALAGDVSVDQVQQQSLVYAQDTGTENAFAVSLSPAPTVVEGSVVTFKAANTNTGPATIALNGGTAVAIKKNGTQALAGGEISAGQIVSVMFDGTYYQLTGAGGGGGDSTAKYIIGESDPALSNALVWPRLYNDLDAPPASPGSLDDEFDAGSLDPSWSWLNQGSTTISFERSHAILYQATHAGESVSAIIKSAPGTPWQVTAEVQVELHVSKFATGYWKTGLILYDSVSGRLYSFGLASQAASVVKVDRFNNPTSFSANQFQSDTLGSAYPRGGKVYLRAEDDGSNIKFSMSFGGLRFSQLYSEARTAFLTNGPDNVGLCINNNGATVDLYVICDWFRRTS